MGQQRQQLDEILTEFEAFKVDAQNSETQSELNMNIHGLTVMANKIMDSAMDFIIQVNYMKLEADVKATKKDWAMNLVEVLQQTFRIGDNAINEAINNRLEIEGAEHQAQAEALSERRAIGFLRNQSYQEFHSDAVEPGPIGFRPNSLKVTDPEKATGRVQFGFTPRRRADVEDSVREIVEYVEPTSTEGTLPFGYRKNKDSEEIDLLNKIPIGFMSQSKPDPIESSRTHEIIFNLETGLFEFFNRDR